MQVHYCNAAMDLIPEKKHLHSMWEDNDIEGQAREIEQYEWLEKYAPGAFVLIDTGDYLVPECCRSLAPRHDHCETYDAAYNLYLVPMSVWNKCQADVIKKDTEWRQTHSRCQQIAK